MALTQTARIPGPGPSWDEQVVPALRKRLESESRTLARRISAISMSSAEPADDYSNSTFHYTSTPAPPPPTTTANKKPNQHQQSSSTSSRPGSRSRTHSQPSNVNNANRALSSSRPTSPPNQSVKTNQSRIPLPQRTRSRTGSLSSQSHSQHRTKTPTPGDVAPVTAAAAADLWVVHERPSHSRLVNEPAPFPPPNSSVSSIDILPEPRPSNDSEERPFEHWYRGEVSRNGGVGEYRVAKRQEMLEIANYGHNIRPKKQNAITDAIDSEKQRRGRPRAGSLGERSSFYLDEEQAKEAARVMDENPLTDNGEEDDDGEEEYYDPMEEYYRPEELPPRTTTPRPSRIPTPTQLQRGQSEPPYFPTSSAGASTSALSSSSATPTQRLYATAGASNGTPQSKRAGTTSPPSASNKGKIKSYNSTTPSPSSNSRLAASKATQAKLAQNKRQREKEEEYRRSIAAYPDTGDDLMNAIPTWTQPVPKAGNWDDVVLPVVARKKGLDGHYERADGSPQQRKDEVTIAPAPGTFGFDHSKYRPPREGEENIPMDEFGTKNSAYTERDDEEQEDEDSQPSHSQSRMETAHDQIRLPTNTIPSKRASSPVPFSSYKPRPSQPEPVGQMNGDVEKGNMKVQRVDADESEDAGKGGCCGCVVM
ncbi:hypothetical protein HHX47_DHR4000468 [Lentinula edodes]|nr:hypothetical protein HHX47_DHR4000468 [Lentinula edodes]